MKMVFIGIRTFALERLIFETTSTSFTIPHYLGIVIRLALAMKLNHLDGTRYASDDNLNQYEYFAGWVVYVDERLDVISETKE